MLIVESGEVFIWGSGSEGQLGLGTDRVKQNQPTVLQTDDKIIQVACGYYHTMLVTGLFRLRYIFADGKCTLFCNKYSLFLIFV